jgi:hypothetical protein
MAKNTVIVSILGDTRDLQQKLGGATSAFGKWAKGAGAAAAIVTGAVVGAAAKGVKSASELQQNIGAMGSVFKENAGQMEKWAAGAAGAVGLAKSEYAGLATVLGSQLRNMGVDAAELGTKTNDLIGLGADLSAQFGGSTSDAVSALSSLLRGERDPIERYGVSINEAAVQAKLAELGLSGLTGEAEKNAKLQATLAILYQQTADAQGAFARESTTLAGAQQRLAAGTENLFATYGTALLPAFTAVTAAAGELINRIQGSDWFAKMTESVTGASNAFADFVFGLLNGTQKIDIGALFAGMLDAAVSGITRASSWLASGGAQALFDGLLAGRQALFDGALQVFPAILDALVQSIPAIVSGLATVVQQLVAFLATAAPLLLGGAVQLFTGLIGALVVIVPQLLGTLTALLPQLITSLLGMIGPLLDSAVLLFTSLIDALPIILPELLGTIIGLLPVLILTILTLIPRLLTAAVQLFTSLISALPLILPKLLIKIVGMLPQIVRSVISMLPALLDAGVQLFLALVTAVPKILGKLGPALLSLGPEMVSTIQRMVPQLLAAGGDLIGGLVRGLWSRAGSVGQTLLNIAGNAISSFKSFLGIHSPSRVFSELGAFTVKGFVKGVDQTERLAVRSMASLSDSVAGAFVPQLAGPELQLHGSAGSAGSAGAAAGGRVYQITLQTLAPSAEVGRAVIDAIRAYETTVTVPVAGGAVIE